MRAVVPPKPHFQDCTCSPSTSLSSRPSTVDRCKSPQLDRQNRYLSLQPWPFSLCRHLLDNRAEGINHSWRSGAQLADGGDVGARLPRQRAWWRRGACVRRVADACTRPGELRAGSPRPALSTRIMGAPVQWICTAGGAVAAVACSLTVDCEPCPAARARTEDAKYVPATLFVGRPNYTIDCV